MQRHSWSACDKLAHQAICNLYRCRLLVIICRSDYLRLAVGSEGKRFLLSATHAANPSNPVERSDELHFAGAGICEAGRQPDLAQGVHKTFGTIRVEASLTGRFLIGLSIDG
jgi:hypothetical protein